jgi:hypothetical protein
MKPSASIDGCPFAQPAPPLSETGDGFYCRLPGGRVRFPAPEEIRRFCAGDGFANCPVNRRWTSIIRTERLRNRLNW